MRVPWRPAAASTATSPTRSPPSTSLLPSPPSICPCTSFVSTTPARAAQVASEPTCATYTASYAATARPLPASGVL